MHASSASQINEAVAQMQPVAPGTADTSAKAPDIDALVKKFMAGQAQPAARMAADSAAAPVAPAVPMANMNSSAPAAESAAAASLATAALAKLVSMPAAGNEDSADYQEYTSEAAYLGALAGAEQGGKAAVPSEFQAQLSNAGAPAQPMAVPDLIQNAQVMVRDGGGEMKVTLTPDGLGEVAMRVSVNEGKVSVQMITESDEAKKLIERQLGELKTSLISQNLNVDGIKVDTATNLGKQMEQQYQDAQRQMAQQNLEQFRQDQQGWRRSFFETPALKVYKGQSEAPRDIPVAPSSKRAHSRRLDLVA
jgi:flagellar hook-length control protein FliK